jgi:S-adenosylmethionine decarboxylase
MKKMSKKPNRRFHLILDIIDIDLQKLNRKEFIVNLITDLARLIKMNILFGPKVIKGTKENPGLTAFCIIDFSHISIHTFKRTNEFYLDIFSCKPFNKNKVIRYIKKVLKVKNNQIFIAQPKYNFQLKGKIEKI